MPLSNMRLWLKADAGTVLGSENIWLDQSGQNNHASQPSGPAQPLLVENALNVNKPVIRFNSAGGQFFYLPNFMAGATAAEGFVVLKRSNVATTAFRLWSMGTEAISQPDYYTVYPYNADGMIYERFGTTVRKTTGKPAQPLDRFHLYNVLSRDGEFTNRLNGVLNYTTSSNTYGFATAPTLGGFPGSYANYFDGDIAELIIYDRALSQTERDAVGTYLNQKYQFIASTAPTPTNGNAVALAGTQVSLTWNNAASNSSVVYDIERMTGGGSFALLATVANTLSWIDTTAVAGTTFTYRIRARNYQGVSGYSASFGVTTPLTGSAMPLSSMRLWLKADAGAVLGPENIWLDQSGLNNHATQVSGPLQPLLVENALNGHPVIRFDGTGQHFALPNFMAGATAAEVFVVLKRSNVTTTAYRLWSMGTEAVSQPDYYTVYPYNADGMIYERFGTTVRKTTGKPAQSLDQYHLYNVVSRDGEFTNRLNGVVNYATNGNTYGFSTAPYLGGFPGSYANYFGGDIAELIIYDRALTGPERERVSWYLAAKYMIPDYDLVGDGLTTAQRLALGLNPFLADSNGDGISDVLSLQLGINPLGTGGFNYHTMPNPNGPPPVDPNDHTGPVITVTEPANAVPLP